MMSRAEALIKTNQSIKEGLAFLNRIRTECTDVNISELPLNLTQEEARVKLRHERRIEFYLEGAYWSDIKRWQIGASLYPSKVIAGDGGLLESKFPNGHTSDHNLFPIPDNELSLNENLMQNPGW